MANTSMTYKFILETRTEHVTTITLNRPEVLNALHPPMHVELEQALDAFAADPQQRVCIITGAGERAFCAGSDLKYAAQSQAAGGPVKSAYPRTGYAGIAERFDLDKPVIAAVNGVAMGGGFEIVLACDLVIAAENASFGLPEPLVGAAALGGGLHRLPRQIGLKHALGMILTGRKLSAQEGLAMGFVNEVVPHAELARALERWANQIIAGSPLAIEASKQTVYRGLDEASLADAMRNQQHYEKLAALLVSEDKREGARAFAEKRQPKWTALRPR